MCYNMMYYKLEAREDSILIWRSFFVAYAESFQQFCDVFVVDRISAVRSFVCGQQRNSDAWMRILSLYPETGMMTLYCHICSWLICVTHASIMLHMQVLCFRLQTK